MCKDTRKIQIFQRVDGDITSFDEADKYFAPKWEAHPFGARFDDIYVRPDITKLPDNLIIIGSLTLLDSDIMQLPDGLEVTDNLDIRNSKILELPAVLVVRGYVLVDDDFYERQGQIKAEKIKAGIDSENKPRLEL